MTRSRRAALAIILLGLCLPSGASAAAIRLDPRPSFALSACWTSAGQLVIPDIHQGTLFVVDPATGGVKPFRRPGRGAKEFNRPSRVACSDDGVVLSDNGWHLVWLDAELEPTGGVYLPGHPVSDPETPVRAGVEYVAIHDLVVHQGSVVVGGSFRLHGKPYKGVARIVPRPLGVDVLHDFHHDHPRWPEYGAYQSFSVRTLASVGDRLYYLNYLGTPRLLDVGSGEPVELPEPLRAELPSLLAIDSTGPESTRLLFSRVRQLRLPVGIWGWRGSLFLLSWRPVEEGLEWELWRRHGDGWRGPWTLPIRAEDLLVAPGTDAWAFVLKGARTTPDVQEVSAVEIVPGGQIEGALR